MIDSSNLSNECKSELYYDYAVASACILVKMEEWFGKKGISGHVNCFFLRNS